MANFKSLVQQGSHFLLQGTLLLSESEREAVLDQSDVQLLLLFWWASEGSLAVPLRYNGDWTFQCLVHGATAAVFSANMKNFESTLSKI